MGKKHTLEITHGHLYDDEMMLREQGVPEQMIERIRRVRHAVTAWDSNPLKKDKELRDELIHKYNIAVSTAYDDLKVAKAIVGNMNEASKSYHRFVFNTMILETYRKAKLASHYLAMEKAASSYAKYNQLDKEDSLELPFDDIVPQNFIPVSDPSHLGIKPIPNIDQRIAELKDKYGQIGEYVDFIEVGMDEELYNYAVESSQKDE